MLALFFFQEALIVFVDVVEEGETQLRRGSYPNRCKMRLDFGWLRQLLYCFCPIVLPPGIPGAERGNEAVGKAVVAQAGAHSKLRGALFRLAVHRYPKSARRYTVRRRASSPVSSRPAG